MKIIVFIFLVFGVLWSHPVSYSIDLKVEYDETKKEAIIYCESDSRNKCGLHSFHLLSKDEKTLLTAKFPFLKKKTKVKLEVKPSKLVFFLRKIPEHTYTVILD